MTTFAIVGASDFNAKSFTQMDAEGLFDVVVAVDGGFNHLEELGHRPDILIGDFDSLEKRPGGIHKISYSPDKDKSDMELALDYASKQGASCVFAFGALGQRLDHALANLQVFAKFSEECGKVIVVGKDEQVFFATGPSVLEFEARNSATISVFAMSEQAEGVFIRGLKWELDNAVFSSRTSLGLSNQFIGKAAMIGVECGTIAVILLDERAV